MLLRILKERLLPRVCGQAASSDSLKIKFCQVKKILVFTVVLEVIIKILTLDDLPMSSSTTEWIDISAKAKFDF